MSDARRQRLAARKADKKIARFVERFAAARGLTWDEAVTRIVDEAPPEKREQYRETIAAAKPR